MTFEAAALPSFLSTLTVSANFFSWYLMAFNGFIFFCVSKFSSMYPQVCPSFVQLNSKSPIVSNFASFAASTTPAVLNTAANLATRAAGSTTWAEGVLSEPATEPEPAAPA